MIRTKQLFIIIGLAIAALLAVTVWHVNWMSAQAADARHNLEDLANCEIYAQLIEQYRGSGQIAAAGQMELHELGSMAERALNKANVLGQPIGSISPLSPTRIGDTPYMLNPTVINVQKVTLNQLAETLYHLTDRTQLNVKDIRLTPARGVNQHQLWDADVTVTYLVYDSNTGPTRP